MSNQTPSTSDRDSLANKLSEWYEQNEDATLTEMENEIDQELAKLRETLVSKLVKKGGEKSNHHVTCPNCGDRLVKNGSKPRKLQMKGGETVEFNRQQLRCLKCEMTIFPPR